MHVEEKTYKRILMISSINIETFRLHSWNKTYVDHRKIDRERETSTRMGKRKAIKEPR